MIEKYWRYTCNSPNGPLRGRIGAEDKAEAENRLVAMGIRPTTLEYIDPSKPEEAVQIPRKGKEIPLGSLPSSPPPTMAFHPKELAEIPKHAKEADRIVEAPKAIPEPPPVKRREKLIYGFPEEVMGIVDHYCGLNGRTKFLEFRQNEKGRLVLAMIIEYEETDDANAKGKTGSGSSVGGNPDELQRPGSKGN